MNIRSLKLNTSASDWYAFLLISFALILRVSFYGFEYYLQLDDYIHFRSHPEGTDFIALCIEGGYFASRPFAVLSDFWIWAKLPYYLGTVIVQLMYAASGILFLKVFRRHFSTGYFFLVFYTLLPLGYEGTYWMAASTRIIPPLFMCALALLLFEKFCDSRKWIYLPGYLLAALCSYVLYEQVLVLSVALCVIMTLVHLLKKQRHACWGFTIVIPIAAYFAFTGYFASDAGVGSRMELVLPFSDHYFDSFLPSVVNQLKGSFWDASVAIFAKGFPRGLQLIARDKLWCAAFIPLIGIFFWFVMRCRGGKPRGRYYHLAPLVGILAALAPISLFFVIANPWVCLRNTVASYLGIALLLDHFLQIIPRKAYNVVTAFFLCFALIVSVSELNDYRQTTQNNNKIVRSIIDADEQLNFEGSIGILNLKETYLEQQNYEYHDHVAGSHISDWSLQGAVQYAVGHKVDYKLCPLVVDGEYYSVGWNRTIKDVSRFDKLMLYDHEAGDLKPVRLETVGSDQYLYTDAGPYARIWEEDNGNRKIEIYP